MFEDRADAAHQLAERLAHLRGRDPLVLAIPRGAVPMGRIIADALEGELDVVLVRKLGAPGNPELAVGAVGEDGEVRVNPDARRLGIDEAYLEREAERQLETLRERRQRYSGVHAPIDPRGRIVVVVDDGAATGSTVLAALRVLRAKGPERLIAALGAAPPSTVRELETIADEVVCIEQPEPFFAVGQFFADFGQVDDEEVVELLRGERD